MKGNGLLVLGFLVTTAVLPNSRRIFELPVISDVNSILIPATINKQPTIKNKKNKKPGTPNKQPETTKFFYIFVALKTVAIAQLVRASDCGSEGRGFEPH